MHKRTKALQIPAKVKQRVYERDGGCCVVCGSNRGQPNAHYIARSHGGLGIEQNIVTLCANCHHAYDNSPMRRIIGEQIKEYLTGCYPDWNEDELYYTKGREQ